MKLGTFRSELYRGARAIGDYQAVASGKPSRIAKRVIRKKAGRVYGGWMRRLVK